jgi:hypothetical protein
VETADATWVKIIPIVLMIVLYSHQTAIVETANVMWVKIIPIVLMIVLYSHHRFVEMVNVTMEKRLRVLMIAPLNALLAKSQMDMVDVFMTALVYTVPLGMIINSAVYVPLNMLTMEMVNVFIIMFIMGAVSQ